MAIRIESIQELLRKEPFSSFKIFTADGKEYPVGNSDFVHVFRAEIFYAYADNERWTIIPISQVTGVKVNGAA